VKVKFKKTAKKFGHDSRGFRFEDGDVRDVPAEYAQHLFKHWADNFESIVLSLENLGPPLHEPITISDITIITLHHKTAIFERCLLPSIPQEVEFIKLDNLANKNWTSVAKALNFGIKKAENNIIICCHEDVRFDRSWFDDLIQQEARLKDWGVLGITGFDTDRRVHWGSDYNEPRKIAFLDECCLILNRKNGLLFDDETFGSWHRYGIDFCLQCHEAGLGVYIITGLAHHDCNPDNHNREWWEQHKIAHRLLEEKWQDKFGSLLPAVIN